ncbi:uncharacterized protein H6S33_009286 [Morchella sextelata]|uniref:uncharacterized protein n=1 Tax=Morchella sextelata TaxID=1174677 RepID=UPI001D04C8AD|nr:uncharacterized protein H6S33_009286 [Morchella sextelata]KAH0612906.1 hypothetical protein H6S33_009286 [Morchella sextelata]
MAALRLRPFIRLANAAVQRPRALNGVSGFSTISMHQLKHPAPASASTRYLPRFLDPRIYWQSSKSDSKAKGPQGKKPWNPATFYIAIFLLIGSQAIQIIALRLNHDERMRRANVKIAVLKEVIERLQRGEDVDVEGMLGVGNEKDEKSWEDVLREIEEEDAVWQAKARKKQGLSETPSSENNTKPEPETFPDKAQKKADLKPRKALSSRDYGYS